MASKSYSSITTSKKKPKEQRIPSAKAPSSHLFASQTAFEFFLFFCLGCGLINQKLNIYKLVSVVCFCNLRVGIIWGTQLYSCKHNCYNGTSKTFSI